MTTILFGGGFIRYNRQDVRGGTEASATNFLFRKANPLILRVF